MLLFLVFFFNDTATAEIYTLSLHDALPISPVFVGEPNKIWPDDSKFGATAYSAYKADKKSRSEVVYVGAKDRKSTRLNSSHVRISYAVFCLKKKNKKKTFNQTLLPTSPPTL